MGADILGTGHVGDGTWDAGHVGDDTLGAGILDYDTLFLHSVLHHYFISGRKLHSPAA